MMRVGITASAFDMLHAGHITMLQEARSVCDHLVCCIHVDPSVERRQKAPPRQPLHERCVQLQAVRYVDRVIPYQTEADLEAIIQLLVPAVRIIGEEYKHTNFTGRDLCKNLGVDIFYNKRRHGLSSSVQRLRDMT